MAKVHDLMGSVRSALAEDTRKKKVITLDDVRKRGQVWYSTSDENPDEIGTVIYAGNSLEDVVDKCYNGECIVTGKQIGRASCRERVSSPV